ncbi:MAG: hypothetical protein OXE53_00040 [Deltaproteobacteria bacterium]|nr:hypothetical protein [Deltaproteobacteria bacterium]
MERTDDMKKVSAEDFCKAFAEQWREELPIRQDDILRAYEHNKPWTEYMLAKKETPCEQSFLRRLATRLCPSLGMGREWYTLDAVYYEEQEDSYIYRPKGGGPYPDCLRVIVEHENGEDVETEMWKLLMFRSPLKVLIFYDYRDDCKTTPKTKDWLDEKLRKLFEMGRKVKRACPEADNVEYLFIVGNRSEDGQTPRWRYCVVEGGGFERDGGDCLRSLVD